MAKERTKSTTKPHRRPATNVEARENQLISLAVDLVEQRLLDGSASAQEVVHFLKLGSSRAKLEREKLAAENKLLDAKAESLQAGKTLELAYKEAVAAMQRYSGNSDDD